MIELAAASPIRKPARLRCGPDGVHLFDRVSGLNILFDECQVPEEKWTRAPRQVSIALTNACDLACPHCYAPKTAAKLKFEQITQWLHELDQNGALGVGFGGGEPTVYRRFADLCAYVTANTELAVTFTTHGHHLDDELLAALAGNVHYARVSMDGVGETYQRIRGRPFDALLKRLEGLRAVTPFGINYVVNAETYVDIDEAIDVAVNAGATEFLLLPEQPVGARHGIDADTRANLQQWVKQFSGRLRLAVSEQGADGLPTCDPFPKEVGLRAYVHITADGVLKRTSYDTDGVGIGDDGVLRAIEILGDKQ